MCLLHAQLWQYLSLDNVRVCSKSTKRVHSNGHRSCCRVSIVMKIREPNRVSQGRGQSVTVIYTCQPHQSCFWAKPQGCPQCWFSHFCPAFGSSRIKICQGPYLIGQWKAPGYIGRFRRHIRYTDPRGWPPPRCRPPCRHWRQCRSQPWISGRPGSHNRPLD